MNCYRVIDPKGKQPVSVMEIVGPPTEDLARGIAARTILGWSPIPMHSSAFQEVMNRLVVKSIDDRFLRWVVTRVHNLFEEADGWAFEGHAIPVAESLRFTRSAGRRVVAVQYRANTSCLRPVRSRVCVWVSESTSPLAGTVQPYPI